MPDRKIHFSEAENNKYNVSNVLNVMNDGSAYHPQKAETAELQEDAQAIEINLEEGAPFTEGIDPEATIGDYMKLHEEEEAYLNLNEEDAEDESADEDINSESEEREVNSEDTPYVYHEVEPNVKSQVIREQAQKARDPFFDDLLSVDNEPAIQRMKERETLADEEEKMQENSIETDSLSALSRVKKPRFKKPLTEETEEPKKEQKNEEMEEQTTSITEPTEENIEIEENEKQENNLDRIIDKIEEDTEENGLDELTQLRADEHQSICRDLHNLQKHLEDARSPMLHKNEVLVPREKTLRLIRSLTVLCDIDPSYIDGASEDLLIDRLACDPGNGEYEPLKRARCRAQTIIENASKQAEIIITDAKVLATQLLAETEAEIKEKYDDADLQIAVRMDTAKEESSKKLNEARSELTTSRQHSVEILSKYLEKAEIDYQGYWERAENTVMASLEQSESILTKAAEIYRKELDVIRQDRDELSEILEHLKRYRPLS